MVARAIVALGILELREQGDLALDVRDVVVGRVELDALERDHLARRVVHALVDLPVRALADNLLARAGRSAGVKRVVRVQELRHRDVGLREERHRLARGRVAMSASGPSRSARTCSPQRALQQSAPASTHIGSGSARSSESRAPMLSAGVAGSAQSRGRVRATVERLSAAMSASEFPYRSARSARARRGRASG